MFDSSYLSAFDACRNWHSTLNKVCCRGFIGPVPPPLWIRMYFQYLIVHITLHYIKSTVNYFHVSSCKR